MVPQFIGTIHGLGRGSRMLSGAVSKVGLGEAARGFKRIVSSFCPVLTIVGIFRY